MPGSFCVCGGDILMVKAPTSNGTVNEVLTCSLKSTSVSVFHFPAFSEQLYNVKELLF